MSAESEKAKREHRDPIFVRAEAALRRAARRARRRAELADQAAAAGETPDTLAPFREMGAAGRDAGLR